MDVKVVGFGVVSVASSNMYDIIQAVGLKDILAVKINGIATDLSTTVQLTEDDTLEFISKDSTEGLDILRHSCAHITAMAIRSIYPEAQFAIGPVIENGYFYDVKLDKPLSIECLSAIQERVSEIIQSKLPFIRKDVSKLEAKALFMDNPFKLEIIDGIEDDTVSLYYIGESFYDLCRGPHIPSTGYIDDKAFKLQDVSGSYWRGNPDGEKLQRVYGTAFIDKKSLQQHLYLIEEAKKRDHRKLGPALDLFVLDDLAAGSVFWLKNGYTLFRNLQNFITDIIERNQYMIVQTPVVLSRKLWEQSGHWDKFRENMFVVSDNDASQMAIKPMNCPAHIILYQHGEVKSYRNLPYRIAEFGMCHRNESSGALHGLLRLRQFTQDDGHIICTPEQIVSESINISSMIKEIYGKFGFDQILVKFSTRPTVRAGSDDVWDRAEKALADASDRAGLVYTINEGEGAFYGPKLEFILKDSLGREWQCGTLQVDFVLPERFGLTYVDKDGLKKQPVMLHRALVGSMERFIGILIEHYAGAFPFWIAPVQVTIASIHEDQIGYCESVREKLVKMGVRVETDYSNETINYKVNSCTAKKVPIMIVCGSKEASDGSVSVRRFGSMRSEVMSIDDFAKEVDNLQQ